MPKKSKSAMFDSTPSYGVAAFDDDAKARSKHQALMQDYHDLQREVDAMRSKLEAGKQRKMVLAAETRFLRSRYEYLVKTKTIDSSRKGKLVLKQAKPTKEFGRKEANQNVLPPLPETKPKKKKQCISKEIAPSVIISPVNQQQRKMPRGGKEPLISDLNHKGRTDARRKNLVRAPVVDLNQNVRLHTNDTALRNTFLAFDLNQDNTCSGKEASVPTRAPIFDLNEISTGDEDFHSTVEAEEAKRSLTRHPNDEDLMLAAICRNAGEGPSRVGKRKISWQDPVALRV